MWNRGVLFYPIFMVTGWILLSTFRDTYLAGTILLFLIFPFLICVSIESRLEKAYRRSLKKLCDNPHDSIFRDQAVKVGRRYLAYVTRFGLFNCYSEAALTKEIEAAYTGNYRNVLAELDDLNARGIINDQDRDHWKSEYLK